jgi:predicted secreted protein
MNSKIFFISILCFFYCSCNNIIDLDKDLNGVYNVPLNSLFTVQVKGNPTTGYNWNYIADSCNDDSIKFLNDNLTGRYVSDNSQNSNGEIMVGVGGTFKFDFKALSAGLNELAFEYKRSWEPEPIETKIARINVIQQGVFSFEQN